MPTSCGGGEEEGERWRPGQVPSNMELRMVLIDCRLEGMGGDGGEVHSDGEAQLGTFACRSGRRE
jgi:hypothetical protein